MCLVESLSDSVLWMKQADISPLNIISHSIILMHYYINNNLYLISLRLHVPEGRLVIGENGMRDKVVVPHKDDDGDDDKSNILSHLLRAFYVKHFISVT